MTMKPLAAIVVLASAFTTIPAFATQRGNTAPNADAVTQQEFKKRIDAYLDIHNKAVKEVGPLKQSKDPAEIKKNQNELAQRIASARADAKAGDIFTPEIKARFRELLAPQLKGEDGRDAKAIVKDDAPASVPFKINAVYPEGKSLPTVPVNLLLNLPTLPKEIEYRIIDKHLILRDTEANIIVDYMLNAIP